MFVRGEALARIRSSHHRHVENVVLTGGPGVVLGEDAGEVGVGDSDPDARLEVLSNVGETGYVLAVSSQNDTTGNLLSVQRSA